MGYVNNDIDYDNYIITATVYVRYTSNILKLSQPINDIIENTVLNLDYLLVLL